MVGCAMSALWADPLDGFCEQCGVNHVYGGGLCSLCQDEEDFLNCPYCHGTSCTGACDDEEGVT
jgi:hypothetical protein